MKCWAVCLGLIASLGAQTMMARAEDDDFLLKLPSQSLPADYQSLKDQNPERVHGTGGWLLDSPQFIQWRAAARTSFLHVVAEPGWGKSVLSRYVLDHLFFTPGDGPLILYYFFRRGQGKQDRAETAVAAMIHQFWTQVPHIELGFPFPNIHRADYEPYRLLKDLWAFFLQHAGCAQSGIVFVLDGLDECEERGRDQLIALLLEFVAGTTVGWYGSYNFNKFLITSRPGLEIDFDNVDNLYGNRPFVRFHAAVRSEVATQELDRLIDIKIPEILPAASVEMQKRFVGALQLVRNKTALWVQLVLDLIQTVAGSKDKLGGVVDALPPTLDLLYDAMLAVHTNDSLKKTLLSIVAAARRPLTIREVQIALVLSQMKEGEVRRLKDIELQPDQKFTQLIRDLCGSVLKVHNAKVFFTHETARQFLLSHEGTDGWNSSSWRGLIDRAFAESVLRRACLNMLSLEDFDKPVPWQAIELEKWEFYAQHGEWLDKRPFFEYAATNWVHHFLAGEHELYPALESSAWKLTDQASPAFQHWQSVFTAEEENRAYTTSHNLALFARLGLYSIVERLLDEGVDCDVPDPRLGTALAAAARRGHEHVVRLLINRGAKVSGPSNPGLKAVEAAIEGGQEATVQLLLQSGATSNHKDDYAQALGAAIRKSNVPIARLLLEHGAGANCQFEPECTALVSAVHRGNLEMVRLLLESGAHVNVPAGSESGILPLHATVLRQDESMMRLLLKFGANVDGLDKENTTALWVAVGRNDVELMRVLFEHGASVDPEQGGWRLEEFYIDEAQELVRLLLQHGLNPEGAFGTQLLALAIQQGEWKVVELLKESGVDLGIRNRRAETPLHKAAGKLNVALVEVLLKHGADVNAIDEKGATPLHAVAATEAERGLGVSSQLIAETLIRHGANVSARDADGATPLHLAADHALPVVVKALVESNANVQDRWHLLAMNASTTVLHLAVAPSYYLNYDDVERTTKIILEYGADVNAQEDISNATALHLAMASLGPSTGKLLIEHGANVTAQRPPKAGSIRDVWENPNPGETPLLAAAYRPPLPNKEHEYAEVVELLIARGAKVDHYDADGRNALLAAAYSDNIVMAWVLLEQLDGAVDVNVRDSQGLTPLMLAARSFLDDIARILLANGARIDDRDPKGRTAFDFARETGSEAVEECILVYHKDAEAARAMVKHPMPLSDPSQRLHLKLQRAVAHDRKKGGPTPPPLYCGFDDKQSDEEEETWWHNEL